MRLLVCTLPVGEETLSIIVVAGDTSPESDNSTQNNAHAGGSSSSGSTGNSTAGSRILALQSDGFGHCLCVAQDLPF